MRRRISKIVLIVFSVVIMGIGISSDVHAYTEEEIQQAKAWLSAHGYSPDAGGASQAYQDYLDGKFDEELGISTTEQMDGNDVTEERESADTKGRNASEPDSGEDKDTSTGKSSNGLEKGEGQTDENTDDAGAHTAAVKETEDLSKNSEDNLIQEEDEVQTDMGVENVRTQNQAEITIYRLENIDTYKEAGLVILFSVFFALVLEAVLILYR